MFFFLLLGSGVFASGKIEGGQAAQSQPSGIGEAPATGSQAAIDAHATAVIKGRVVIYGNEPHTFVGIAADDGREYAVYSPSHEEELRRLQGHSIEFTVIFIDEPKVYSSLFLKGGTVSPISWIIQD